MNQDEAKWLKNEFNDTKQAEMVQKQCKMT